MTNPFTSRVNSGSHTSNRPSSSTKAEKVVRWLVHRVSLEPDHPVYGGCSFRFAIHQRHPKIDGKPLKSAASNHSPVNCSCGARHPHGSMTGR